MAALIAHNGEAVPRTGRQDQSPRTGPYTHTARPARPASPAAPGMARPSRGRHLMAPVTFGDGRDFGLPSPTSTFPHRLAGGEVL